MKLATITRHEHLLPHMPSRIINNPALRGCWAKGYHARYRGVLRDACPYTTHHQVEWKLGFDFADAQLLIKNASTRGELTRSEGPITFPKA